MHETHGGSAVPPPSIPQDNVHAKEQNTGITYEQVMQLIVAAFSHIEFSAGLGMGYYLEGDVFDIGAGVGMYGNIASIHYQDGKWYTGQELYVGATAGIVHEFGFSDYYFMQNGQQVNHESWQVINSDQTNITIFSVAGYLIAGGSLSIEYDLASFYDDLADILG